MFTIGRYCDTPGKKKKKEGVKRERAVSMMPREHARITINGSSRCCQAPPDARRLRPVRRGRHSCVLSADGLHLTLQL
ncbi:hypothetical protein EYF80_012943 [Liparis tanakae]|uniref:Uncharacterized protein n=1 Tax=Liparis tanakae TaxID=230148 RepID=A0A4Z2IG34_9TELE|nr:hypothetical protein EYF80_012943 [Liparis tanakae]